MLPGGDQWLPGGDPTWPLANGAMKGRRRTATPGGTCSDTRRSPDFWRDRARAPARSASSAEPEIERQEGVSPDVVTHAVRADRRLVAVGLNHVTAIRTAAKGKQAEPEDSHCAIPPRCVAAHPPAHRRRGASRSTPRESAPILGYSPGLHVDRDAVLTPRVLGGELFFEHALERQVRIAVQGFPQPPAPARRCRKHRPAGPRGCTCSGAGAARSRDSGRCRTGCRRGPRPGRRAGSAGGRCGAGAWPSASRNRYWRAMPRPPRNLPGPPCRRHSRIARSGSGTRTRSPRSGCSRS